MGQVANVQRDELLVYTLRYRSVVKRQLTLSKVLEKILMKFCLCSNVKRSIKYYYTTSKKMHSASFQSIKLLDLQAASNIIHAVNDGCIG